MSLMVTQGIGVTYKLTFDIDLNFEWPEDLLREGALLGNFLGENTFFY